MTDRFQNSVREPILTRFPVCRMKPRQRLEILIQGVRQTPNCKVIAQFPRYRVRFIEGHQANFEPEHWHIVLLQACTGHQWRSKQQDKSAGVSRKSTMACDGPCKQHALSVMLLWHLRLTDLYTLVVGQRCHGCCLRAVDKYRISQVVQFRGSA